MVFVLILLIETKYLSPNQRLHDVGDDSNTENLGRLTNQPVQNTDNSRHDVGDTTRRRR